MFKWSIHFVAAGLSRVSGAEAAQGFMVRLSRPLVLSEPVSFYSDVPAAQGGEGQVRRSNRTR